MASEGKRDSKPTSGQFSLRFVLALFVVLSIALTVSFGLRNWLSSAGLLLLSITFVTILVVTIVYGSGNFRVFCVGAIVPMTLLVVVASGFIIFLVFDRQTPDPLYYLDHYAQGIRYASIPVWLLAVVMGFLSVGVRTIIQSKH